MINQSNLEVQLTLDDQLTANLNKSFNNLKKTVGEASDSVKQMGRNLEQAGRTMTFLGAAITGPMALAFKTTSEYSIEAGDSLKKLSAVSIEFQKTIGTAMVPVVEKLTFILQELNRWFQALDPRVRTMIVQGLLLTGIFLVLVGALESTAGKILKLTAATVQFALSNAPLMLIIGVLIAIITYWEKIRDVVMPIIAWFQVAVDMVAIGYYKLADAIAKSAEFLARSVGLEELANQWKIAGDAIQMTIKDLEANMTSALSGQGWSQSVDQTVMNIKQKFDELKTFFSQDFKVSVDTTMQQFSQNFGQTFKQAYDNAVNIGRNSAGILINQVDMFSTRFGQAFGQMIVDGKDFGESMKQMFRDMATAFIAEVTAMIAKWLAFMALKSMFGFGFFHEGGQVMHSGGVVHAHSGLAVDEVPIIAQRGEGILSRRGMDALGGPGVLNALNAGRSKGGGVYVNIESASFSTEEEAEDTLQRLSRLIDEKTRSRIR